MTLESIKSEIEANVSGCRLEIVPKFGAHDLEPTQNPKVWKAPLVQITKAGTDEHRND